MKEYVLPETERARTRRGARLRRRCGALNACTVVFGILAVVCLLGVLAAVIVSEFKRDAATLCYELAGGLGGGTILFALLAVLFEHLSSREDARTLDYFERCEGEESFFVGDETFATFTERGLRIHGKVKREILVPYGEIKVFSVCSRRRPREEGERSVVFGIPARYLVKEDRGAPPVYVQTDAKPRLFSAIERHGLTVLGEREEGKKGKFTVEKRFYMPNRRLRRNALLLLAGGIVLAVAGVVVLFFQTAVGSVLLCLGAVVAGRAVYAFFRARALFAVYKEGLFFRESEGRDSVFLKWGEIVSLSQASEEGYPVIKAELPYGTYNFPRAAGAYDYILEHHGGDLR